jgi:ADP-ribosylglycohydrolase/fructose-1,6-bisphosphatase/inositol monophosphatase family enzyme
MYRRRAGVDNGRVTSTSLERELDCAVDAAREAGRILREDFHRAGGPRGGGDKAEADVEAEHVIRRRLTQAFPFRYLGEETGRGDGEAGGPVWAVDPNDGTRDYLVGRRGSAVSIGLLRGGRPVLGVVFAFAYPDGEGDLFTWAEGCGPVRRNGAEAKARLPEKLGVLDVVLVSSKGDRDPETNLRCCDPARYRTLPSIAHRLALLAAGEAAATSSLWSPRDWDYAGGHALLRAAGGAFVDQDGREVSYAEDGSSRCENGFGGSVPVARAIARRPWGSAMRGAWGDERPARVPPGRAIADAALLRRAQGCLLGHVAGDSLGSLVEFQRSQQVRESYPDGPRRLEDGGVWGTLAGQPTDDFEMALALARSIVARAGFEAPDVLEAYRRWYASGPFDIGGTTRGALTGTLDPASQANGALMRCGPLGVFAHALPPPDAAALAREDSALTHPHPVCGDASAAFVVAIGHALRHGHARGAWEAARAWADVEAAPPVQAALDAAVDAPPVCDGEKIGWVLITLQNAFYELLHASSLEEGVIATVRRGGDTDTNAAVAGALLGAVHGRVAVPAQWRDMILSCRAHRLRARHPRPMAYWPADVLELAECLLAAGTPPSP